VIRWRAESASLQASYVGPRLTQREYADKVGKPQTSLVHRWQAAMVASTNFRDHWRALSEIHVAPNGYGVPSPHSGGSADFGEVLKSAITHP